MRAGLLDHLLYDLKVRHVADWQGNRSTIATYRDVTGAHRSTKLNGHLHEQTVTASIVRHRTQVNAN